MAKWRRMDACLRHYQKLLFALSFTLLTFTGTLQAEQSDSSGVWKNVDGREMTATLLLATDDEAEFILPNGKRARIPWQS
ncbi:MAG: hypothetical protein ACI8T1_002207 [Verrucomicrobiales bacterium]|jgi:hypothetical protein